MAKNYINNKDLYQAMIEYKKLYNNDNTTRIPEYVGKCILLIANKLANRPNFMNYSYRDEMIADGIENCLHRSTKIMTIEHGPIEIEKIVNQTVTIKCKDGIWRPAKCKSFGKQMLYEYGFASFNTSVNSVLQTVIATSNHRWFVTSRRNEKNLLDYNNEVVTNLRIGDALENAKHIDELDKDAVLHGLIFGDGTGHKTTVYGNPAIVKQGSKYSFIRVCKQDLYKDEITLLLISGGYKCSYPPSANGDPVFYIGKWPLIKDLPFTTDPSYISGFIHGWWLADGNKTTNTKRKQITTSNKEAAYWLLDYASYAGYQVTSFNLKERKEGDGSFENGKPLYIISLAESTNYEPKVRYIKEFGEDEVFCLIEPETNSFVLANGLLTGNCILYIHNFDPEKTDNPFAYITQIISYAFIRRIQKEKKYQYIKLKNMQNSISEQDVLDHRLLPKQMYDNNSDYIAQYENSLKEKKIKAKAKQGIEKFLEEDTDE